MASRWARAGCMLVALTGLCLADRSEAGKADNPPPLADLNKEVTALQALYQLQLTRAQMTALRKIAKETADKPPRPAGKNNENVRKALLSLRAALLQPDKDEEILKRIEQLEEVQDKEKFELDDDIEITEEARTQAPRVLRLLTAKQVAVYLGSLADDIPDPFENIREAIDKVRGLNDEKWKELRRALAEESGRLLAGLDADKAEDLGNQVVQLLIVARGLNAEEFKKQRPDLDKKAHAIIGPIGPTDVLRHIVEHNLAELLSNPRLAAALDARLK